MASCGLTKSMAEERSEGREERRGGQVVMLTLEPRSNRQHNAKPQDGVTGTIVKIAASDSQLEVSSQPGT